MQKKTKINHLLDLTAGWEHFVAKELEENFEKLNLSEEEADSYIFENPLHEDLFGLYQYTGCSLWDEEVELTEEKLQEFFNTKVIPLILKHSRD